jgi:hypothetical protein
MKPNDTLDYQNILRAIGQGIEKLGVESFDIVISDNQDFVVSGVYRDTSGEPEPKAGFNKSLPSQIFNAAKRNYRRRTGAALFRFSGIRFTPSNVELLDRAGKASRSSWGGRRMKKPLSISYVLRTAGSFLDNRGSRFVRLSWRYNVLTLWHIQETGVEAKEIFTQESLSDDFFR